MPDETETEIGRLLSSASPIRAIAERAAGLGRASTRSRSRITGPATGWVGETAARPQTGVADAGRAAVPGDGALRHAGGDPGACSTTRRSISTSGSPRRWSAAFAAQESAAFVTGDGTNKPKGFLAYTMVAEASWSWGKIGYVATGVGRRLRGDAIRPTC